MLMSMINDRIVTGDEMNRIKFSMIAIYLVQLTRLIDPSLLASNSLFIILNSILCDNSERIHHAMNSGVNRVRCDEPGHSVNLVNS